MSFSVKLDINMAVMLFCNNELLALVNILNFLLYILWRRQFSDINSTEHFTLYLGGVKK